MRVKLDERVPKRDIPFPLHLNWTSNYTVDIIVPSFSMNFSLDVGATFTLFHILISIGLYVGF